MHISWFFKSLVPARFETRTTTGLVKGHAYSVTAVEEVRSPEIVLMFTNAPVVTPA